MCFVFPNTFLSLFYIVLFLFSVPRGTFFIFFLKVSETASSVRNLLLFLNIIIFFWLRFIFFSIVFSFIIAYIDEGARRVGHSPGSRSHEARMGPRSPAMPVPYDGRAVSSSMFAVVGLVYLYAAQ